MKNLPKILVVDDIPANIKILGIQLRKSKYDVFIATDGENAIKIANKSLPDLILLDIMMPGMNGFEVCERLKDDPSTREIPIIFLTAKNEVENMVKGFELGAVDYITKPFNPPELLARVRLHIELKRAKEDLVEYADRLNHRNKELEESLKRIKNLEGLLPICSNCKSIRKEDSDSTDQNSWVDIEEYLEDLIDADITHGICPKCKSDLYPDLIK